MSTDAIVSTNSTQLRVLKAACRALNGFINGVSTNSTQLRVLKVAAAIAGLRRQRVSTNSTQLRVLKVLPVELSGQVEHLFQPIRPS